MRDEAYGYNPHSPPQDGLAKSGPGDMTLKRWDGAAYQDIAAIKRWDGASWVDLTILKRWDGVSWVDITLPGGGGGLSATADKAFVGAGYSPEGIGPTFVTLTTDAITVTATGGMGAGPTYSWSRVTGDSSVLCDSPTSATTTFSCSVPRNQERSAVYRCTITRGAESVQINVNVLLTYYPTGPDA
jgi:hypothetical protein